MCLNNFKVFFKAVKKGEFTVALELMARNGDLQGFVFNGVAIGLAFFVCALAGWGSMSMIKNGVFGYFVAISIIVAVVIAIGTILYVAGGKAMQDTRSGMRRLNS